MYFRILSLYSRLFVLLDVSGEDEDPWKVERMLFQGVSQPKFHFLVKVISNNIF